MSLISIHESMELRWIDFLADPQNHDEFFIKNLALKISPSHDILYSIILSFKSHHNFKNQMTVFLYKLIDNFRNTRIKPSYQIR